MVIFRCNGAKMIFVRFMDYENVDEINTKIWYFWGKDGRNLVNIKKILGFSLTKWSYL